MFQAAIPVLVMAALLGKQIYYVSESGVKVMGEEKQEVRDFSRHGTPWSGGEEQAMLYKYKAGRSIEYIAQHHKRTEHGIRCRLEKLGHSAFKGSIRKDKAENVRVAYEEIRAASSRKTATETMLEGEAQYRRDYQARQEGRMRELTMGYGRGFDCTTVIPDFNLVDTEARVMEMLNNKELGKAMSEMHKGMFAAIDNSLKDCMMLGTSRPDIYKDVYEKVFNKPEKIMSKFFQKIAFVNGAQVSDLSATRQAEVIAAKEAQIAKLEGIGTKPPAVKREIAQHKADLAEFIAYLEEVDAEANKVDPAK